MAILIIVRHGQSQWNLENRFTGETDIDLTVLGEQEAKKAGELLSSYNFDEAYTSVLKRAIRTLEIIIKESDHKDIKFFKSKALNERNYGDLQGLNKSDVEKQYGSAQFLIWRRSYDVRPPNGESLADTYARVIPYYKTEIESKLMAGKNVLIVAHGNSLRALMMYLENISQAEIPNVDLPTGKPKAYEFDASMLLTNFFYLS